METIIRYVKDLGRSERSAIEQLVGHTLHETEQLVIQVMNAAVQPTAGGGLLPDWCNVYAGMSDEQIADVEQAVLRRADLSRTSE
jgi:hypothetical protein